MKLLVLALFASAIMFSGCETPSATPYPNNVTAIFVGLGYRCDKKELRKKGSDLDISTMVEIVRRAYHDYNEFKLRCHYQIIQDELATIQNVKTAIRQAMYQELAIIYFSCKATQVPTDGDNEESDGLDECLQLYDGLLKDNDIWEILQCAKGRVFIIFDTCNSETMFKISNNEKEDKINILMDLHDEIKKKEKTNTTPLNLVCWSACEDNETIKEKGTGSKLTNCIYFKSCNDYLTYDEMFNKCKKSLDYKQNIKKSVIGEDFSNLSIFR